MNIKRLSLLFAIVAAFAAHAEYPSTLTEWFSQSFDAIGLGAPFTHTNDVGQIGGNWKSEPIADGVAFVADVSGRHCIVIDTSVQASDRIRFRSDEESGNQTNRFDFAISADPVPWFPTIDDADTSRLVLLDVTEGLATFGAWTRDGWVLLYGHDLMLGRTKWYDCRAEFAYLPANYVSANSHAGTYVTYSVKTDSGSYLPLTDASDEMRQCVTYDDLSLRAITFRGQGCVGAFQAYGSEFDASRTRKWTAESSEKDPKEWSDKNNWYPCKEIGQGDLATVKKDAYMLLDKYLIVTWKASELSISNTCVHLTSGDVEIKMKGGYTPTDIDFTALGTVVVEPNTAFRAFGCYTGIEMGVGSVLMLSEDCGLVLTGSNPFYLDGVQLDIGTEPDPTEVEALALITGPFGTGGTPIALTADGNPVSSGWKLSWRGNLDGSSTLWLVSTKYDASGETAMWIDGTWGNLVTAKNWNKEPSASLAAQMNYGFARVSAGDAFAFTKLFDIGANASGGEDIGEVAMAGGRIAGSGAVVIGRNDGQGSIDMSGGEVSSSAYGWHSALTVAATNSASGVATIRGGSWLARGANGVSVGAGGVGALQLSAGTLVADGNVGVGDKGTFEISGGSLVVSNSFYIGNADRLATYNDAVLTLTGGAISNISHGAGGFYVGSNGGVGSLAEMYFTNGEIYVDSKFVAGRNRSANVEMVGGTLIAPEIGVGTELLGDSDEAVFALRGGRVETAGFTSGTVGERCLTLGGGELVATGASDNFFGTMQRVAFEGTDALFVTTNNVKTGPDATLMGSGGFCKTGAGTLTVDGYSAWLGVTTILEGKLDMDGGMVQGDVVLGEKGSIDHVKYDHYDDNYAPDATASSTYIKKWLGTGTSSTMSYLRVRPKFSNKTAGNFILVKDSAGEIKGGLRILQVGINAFEYEGYTTAGWRRLYRPSSTPFNEYVQIVFDFSQTAGVGKPYVIYYAGYKPGRGTRVYRRLSDVDGITAFPVRGINSAAKVEYNGAAAQGSSAPDYEMELDTAKLCRWIAGDGAWTTAANWSGNNVPTTKTFANFDTKAIVSLTGTCNAMGLVVNAPVTLANGTLTIPTGAITSWNKIDGSGVLTLSDATLSGGGTYVQVDMPLAVEAGKTGTVTGNISINDALRGSGTLNLAAKLYGDTSAFAGTVKVSGTVGGIYDIPATYNGLASWQVTDAYPFFTNTATYTFGAFSGTLAPGSGAIKKVALVVGARDEDCAISGSWVSGGGSGVEWTAETATLTYSVANTAYLTVSGGGTLSLGAASGLPTKLSFTGKGGVLTIAKDVKVDPSAAFADSTAAIVFDDEGENRVWSSAIAASNAGGFVKRGAGTLTWEKAPGNSSLDVTIEEGTLVVPYGTSLGYVQIAKGAKLMLDMGGIAHEGNALVVAGANRDLDPKTSDCFSIANAEGTWKTETNSRNGIIIYCGAGAFVWNGESTGTWQDTSNWLMDGGTASRYPGKIDNVVFPSTEVTVTLQNSVSVRSISGTGSLAFTGEGRVRSVTIDSGLTLASGKLTLVDGVTLTANEASLAGLSGTGTFTVKSNTLTVNTYDSALSGTFKGAINVTNFTLRGVGMFTYTPTVAYEGNFAVDGGIMKLNCVDAMTDQSAMHLTMKAGAILDLGGQTVNVASFKGAGTIENGFLVPEDRTFTQSGGDLTVPAVDRMTYVASRAGEKLVIQNAENCATVIVVPRTWFVAGVSGRNAIFCEYSDIIWDIKRRGIQKPTTTGDGWWSISGSGFTVRLR